MTSAGQDWRAGKIAERADRYRQALRRQADLFNAAAEACGLKVRADGVKLIPTVDGEPKAWPTRRSFVGARRFTLQGFPVSADDAARVLEAFAEAQGELPLVVRLKCFELLMGF